MNVLSPSVIGALTVAGWLVYALSQFATARTVKRNPIVPTARVLVTRVLGALAILLPSVVAGFTAISIVRSFGRSSLWTILTLLAILIAYGLIYLYFRYGVLYCRRLPEPVAKFYYEIRIASIMKTSDTYPARIVLYRVVVGERYGDSEPRLLKSHVPLRFHEQPIEARAFGAGFLTVLREEQTMSLFDAAGHPMQKFPCASTLSAKISAPAFDVDPKEQPVAVEDGAELAFLMTPRKSGRQLLRVDFLDNLQSVGYFETVVRVADFVLFRRLPIMDWQLKIIRSIAFLIGLAGTVVALLHTLKYI